MPIPNTNKNPIKNRLKRRTNRRKVIFVKPRPKTPLKVFSSQIGPRSLIKNIHYNGVDEDRAPNSPGLILIIIVFVTVPVAMAYTRLQDAIIFLRTNPEMYAARLDLLRDIGHAIPFAYHLKRRKFESCSCV